MAQRPHRSSFAFVVVAVTLACAPLSLWAAAPRNWKAPRNEFGQPNLQGVWTNATITPLERPDRFGDRLVLTDAEVRQLEAAEANYNERADAPSDLSKPADPTCRSGSGPTCGYNNFWIDRGTRVLDINGERRSSIVVDPPNGKIPFRSGRGAMMARAAAAAEGEGARGDGARRLGSFDGPEVRPLGERCLLAFGSSSGPPMLPVLYNNHYQIVQNKDTVTILVEMVHDARIVRLGGEHLPATFRKWMGDSIGYYEGDTLVVETTNFPRQQNFRGASQNLKVTERFTRVAPDTIVYKFTVEDPTVFSRPWSGEEALHATDEQIFEYACHEGNYALPGILAGAREQERGGSGNGLK